MNEKFVSEHLKRLFMQIIILDMYDHQNPYACMSLRKVIFSFCFILLKVISLYFELIYSYD
jgi:hypothetical protein